MLKRAELRYNNLVLKATAWSVESGDPVMWSGSWYRIEPESADWYQLWNYPNLNSVEDVRIDNMAGIPLTDDILVNKLGFIKHVKKLESDPFPCDLVSYIKGRFRLLVWARAEDIMSNTFIPMMDAVGFTTIEINTVHHLQNVYYVFMNNQELIE